MAKKVNFYTKKQISELKKLSTNKEVVEAWAKKNGRKASAVLGTISYYRYVHGKSRKTNKKTTSATTTSTNVIKSRSRGEFVIPVSSVEVRTTNGAVNLIFKY